LERYDTYDNWIKLLEQLFADNLLLYMNVFRKCFLKSLPAEANFIKNANTPIPFKCQESKCFHLSIGHLVTNYRHIIIEYYEEVMMKLMFVLSK
jgi:hypothetical protein